MKKILISFENLIWGIRCEYNLWLHGPYGLAKVVEKIPYRFLVKFLRKYGAKVGDNCRFERGINLHRPLGKRPFENLIIGNNVYLGHNTLIDLTEKVLIRDDVIFASRCQIWTHASYYQNPGTANNQYGEHLGVVTVEEGAIIYSGVVISHGISIGRYSRIGANSLVNKNVDEFTFVGGVPAKILKS